MENIVLVGVLNLGIEDDDAMQEFAIIFSAIFVGVVLERESEACLEREREKGRGSRVNGFTVIPKEEPPTNCSGA